MILRRLLIAVVATLVFQSCCLAGEVYKVTSPDGNGKKVVTYEVKFGGGKLFEQFTAFDPASKKFLYLDWKRDGAKPEPAGSIWDYKTGATILLYKFPGVAQPLPIIPSIDDLKICPMTGNKIISKEETIIYD